MKQICIIILHVFCVNGLFAQPHKTVDKTYHIIFQNMVGDSLLQSDSIYNNYFGEPFKVRSFEYYISHIRLQDNSGKYHSVFEAPRLINQADSTTKQLSFITSSDKVTGIQFLLGIDSITNVSGVQTGDLDPAKGMFWIWNTGYIMAKLEGSSPVSKAPGKQYSYDIGGYKEGENSVRQINLAILPTANTDAATFIITADISKWFYGKNDIRISEQPMCHSPGQLAMQVADNYAAMFSIRAK